MNRGLGTLTAGSLAFLMKFIATEYERAFRAIFIGAAIFVIVVTATDKTKSVVQGRAFVMTSQKERNPNEVITVCKLINNDMKQFVISSETDAIREIESKGDQVEITCFITDAVKNDLKKFHDEAKHYLHTVFGPKLVLLIDGKCLMYALDPSLGSMLLNLSLNCSTVVCCRVSPLQKAQVSFPSVSFFDMYITEFFLLPNIVAFNSMIEIDVVPFLIMAVLYLFAIIFV